MGNTEKDQDINNDMTSSNSAIPSTISSYDLNEIVRDAKDFAIVNGLGFRSRANNASLDVLEVAPLSLFPSPFPKDAFILAKDVQTSVNMLMHKIAMDAAFIEGSLKETFLVDDFTRNMHSVLQKVEKIGISQPLNFGLFRTDYMVNQQDKRLLQVESNAIAAGFANLGPKTSRLHRFIVEKYFPEGTADQIPVNEADVNFPKSFIRAWEEYAVPTAVILYVTEDVTINLCDQRGHDFAISILRPDIRVIRRSWTQLHACCQVDNDRRLVIDGKHEVALVYYRFCYDPSHYTQGEASWDLRLKIESSRAIKCPSIGYHLSGVKKFQEVLSDTKVVEQFLPTKEAQRLLETFAGFWDLNSQDVIDMAFRDPDKFVLKPQREGGGHNIYGRDIIETLNPIRNSPERLQYILMQMIYPSVIDNILIGPDVYPKEGHVDQVTCELGIFGSILGSKDGIVFNNEDGHVLRCKKLGVNEGGISAGFGAIDSPLLI